MINPTEHDLGRSVVYVDVNHITHEVTHVDIGVLISFSKDTAKIRYLSDGVITETSFNRLYFPYP